MIHRIIDWRTIRRCVGLLLFLFLLVLPSGCNDDSSTPTQDTTSPSDTVPASDTASASLTINWKDEQPYRETSLLRTAALNCQATGVENVMCNVYDTAGTKIATGGPWPCTSGGGSIDRIPAGNDRIFVVLAEDSAGDVRYQGETAGIAITPGEITANVVVDAFPFTPEPTAPENDTMVPSDPVNLEWQAVSNAEAYIVQLADDSDFQNIIIDKTTAGLVEALPPLETGKTYYWRISAVDRFNNFGSPSKTMAFATLPAISGSIAASGNTPISGITVNFVDTNGENSTSATTDASGNYTYTVPFSGWSGTATPVEAMYNFSPGSRDYENVTQNQTDENYTGTAIVPTISGNVSDAEERPLSGVTLNFTDNNGSAGSATTNSDGDYSKAVPFGWSGTATPDPESGFTFEPTSRPYNNVMADVVDQDYTGTTITYTISGIVRNADGPISGVTITFSNNGGSAITDASGNYSNVVPFDWSGTATPDPGSGFSFDPGSRSYNDVRVDQEQQNYTGTPTTYTISGIVSGESRPIPGLTITFVDSDGGGRVNVTTGGSGEYSHEVPFGWSGTATPAPVIGFNFDPESRRYTNVRTDQTGQNYTRTAIRPVIAGTVSDTNGPIRGIAITFIDNDGDGRVTVITDGSGRYRHDVPFGWDGTATPDPVTGFNFDPESRRYTNVRTDQTGQDYTRTTIRPEISGTVRDGNGPIRGIAITFIDSSGGGRVTVTTDGSGVYRHRVSFGWNGTASPEPIAGFNFDPGTRSYSNVRTNQTGQDYTRTPIRPEISGFVRDTDGEGIGGVTITFVDRDGGGRVSVTTNNSGRYRHDVPFTWNGTAGPDPVAGFTYDPESRTYRNVATDQTQQDYTRSAIRPEISGAVNNPNGAGISGVTITFTPNGGSVTTDGAGEYSHAVPFGWTGTARPERSGFDFEPETRSYNNTTNNRANQNYTGITLPVVTVTAPDDSASEASEFPGPGTFQISRTGSTATTLTVFFTMTGTADNGTDYQAITGPVTFDQQQSALNITLMPLNDQNDEPVETAIMTISANSAYTLGTSSAATISIIDDDQSLLVSCPNGGGGDFNFRGFYISDYPGINISSVNLYTYAGEAGTYTLILTVREDRYDGRLVGRSTTTVTHSGQSDDFRTTFFSFPQRPGVTQGGVLTFAIEVSDGPLSEVLYAALTSGTCPVTQTTDTNPPLSTIRRNGIPIQVFGDRN